MNADESNNESSIGGQLSNDSGIATEDSWTCDGGRPSAEKCTTASIHPFGMHCSRSFTAPSTPASTVSWKGGLLSITVHILVCCHLQF